MFSIRIYLPFTILLTFFISLSGYAMVPPTALEMTHKKHTPKAKSMSAITAKEQLAFFNRLQTLCGQAFKGKLVVDTSASDRFADSALLMHVRECSENEIKIPFYVGDDASRTWVITKTGGGLLLKHDHRHQDGSHDDLTMYGGHTQTLGSSHNQVFPVDVYTQALFTELGYPQSLSNIWEIFIYPDTFTYRLTRAGFEFRVVFDLTQPVVSNMHPWGHQ